MLRFQTTVLVRLRPSILDPEGKAIQHALQSLSFHQVHNVRVGKEIELFVDAEDEEVARRIVDDLCHKLLANPVMEDYSFTLTQVKG
jgi:phosphoribosylformylglycinamidine synthase subunit PurS